MGIAALGDFGISMDELAVGFPMVETIGAITIQAFTVSLVRIMAGVRLVATLGQRTSRIAGIIAVVAFVVLRIYLIARRSVSGLPEI